MSYIDLAKFYATEVAESNSSKKPFIYIPNNIGSFILNTALERISKTLDDIPLKQVTLEIEKIQKELGKGWEKDKKGNYRNTTLPKGLSNMIADFHEKPDAQLLYNIEGKIITNEEKTALFRATKSEELKGEIRNKPPAVGILLTPETLADVVRSIGFKSPVRGR